MPDVAQTAAAGIDLATGLPIASAVVGLGEAIFGGFGANSAEKKIEALLAKRKAFTTPDEVYQAKNAVENASQTGYDATTLGYLTGSTNNAFSSSLATLQRLGGDPNDAAHLFNQQMDAIFKIGADDHALKTQKFSQFIGALDTVAANKAAEAKSKEDLLKDQIALAAGNKQVAEQNVNNGINTVVGGLTSAAQMQLFKNKTLGNTVNVNATGNFTPVNDNTITGMNAVNGIVDNRPNNFAWDSTPTPIIPRASSYSGNPSLAVSASGNAAPAGYTYSDYMRYLKLTGQIK